MVFEPAEFDAVTDATRYFPNNPASGTYELFMAPSMGRHPPGTTEEGNTHSWVHEYH
jgi:hypothetical protein